MFDILGDPEKVIRKSNIVIGRIAKILSNVGLLVEIPNQKAGIVHVTEISDSFSEDPLSEYTVGKYVR